MSAIRADHRVKRSASSRRSRSNPAGIRAVPPAATRTRIPVVDPGVHAVGTEPPGEQRRVGVGAEQLLRRCREVAGHADDRQLGVSLDGRLHDLRHAQLHPYLARSSPRGRCRAGDTICVGPHQHQVAHAPTVSRRSDIDGCRSDLQVAQIIHRMGWSGGRCLVVRWRQIRSSGRLAWQLAAGMVVARLRWPRECGCRGTPRTAH